MTPPTTKWTRLRRRLAADGNPLRRPADKAAAWLLPIAVVAFLVLSPLAVAAADALAHAGVSAEGQAQRSWRQVPATTLAPAAGPAQSADSWTTCATLSPRPSKMRRRRTFRTQNGASA